MTQEIIGTKYEIECWVDANSAKFKGETIRIWPISAHRKVGKMLGEWVIK